MTLPATLTGITMGREAICSTAVSRNSVVGHDVQFEWRRRGHQIADERYRCAESGGTEASLW